MNKRQLLAKIAKIAVTIFVFSIIYIIAQIPYRSSLEKKHIERLNLHVAELTQQSQKFLQDVNSSIESEINASGTDKLASRSSIQAFQSGLLIEHQQIDQVKRFVWMSDPEGQFIFGAPVDVFTKLNSIYDQFVENSYYKNRDEFLLKYVNEHEEINLADFEASILGREERGSFDRWRYERPANLVLTSPVTNSEDQVVGKIFLKVDDSVNSELYLKKWRVWESSAVHGFGIFFTVLAVISGLFLWFLLPTWVYIDAGQRDLSNPGAWAFITLISLIFGLAIYLITRPATLRSFNCPKCENELNGGGAFCPHCGFDISSTLCPQCQYPIKQDWSFCPSCRAGIETSNRSALPQARDAEKISEGEKESDSSSEK